MISKISKEEIELHKGGKDTPNVYVGTYRKYNEGSLYGMWIDLTSFADYNEFIHFCKRLHSDEHDPELMFQDYENFPRELYSECFGEETFDKIVEYGNLSDDDKEMVEAYHDYISTDAGVEEIRDKCLGKFDSEEDYAEQYIDECYDSENPLYNYIDYGKVADDLFCCELSFCDGFVFSHY